MHHKFYPLQPIRGKIILPHYPFIYWSDGLWGFINKTPYRFLYAVVNTFPFRFIFLSQHRATQQALLTSAMLPCWVWLKMSNMNVSEGYDSKADTAYSKCPSKIKIRPVSDQLFIESSWNVFEEYKGGCKYNASLYLTDVYDMSMF